MNHNDANITGDVGAGMYSRARQRGRTAERANAICSRWRLLQLARQRRQAREVAEWEVEWWARSNDGDPWRMNEG